MPVPRNSCWIPTTVLAMFTPVCRLPCSQTCSTPLLRARFSTERSGIGMNMSESPNLKTKWHWASAPPHARLTKLFPTYEIPGVFYSRGGYRVRGSAHILQRRSARVAGPLPGVPPPRRDRPDAAADLRRGAPLGQGHQRRRAHQEDAALVRRSALRQVL